MLTPRPVKKKRKLSLALKKPGSDKENHSKEANRFGKAVTSGDELYKEMAKPLERKITDKNASQVCY